MLLVIPHFNSALNFTTELQQIIMDDLTAGEQRQIHEILGEFFRDRLASKGLTFNPEYDLSDSNRQITGVLKDLSDNFLSQYREGVQGVVDRFCPDEGPETSLAALEDGFYAAIRQLITDSDLNWNKIVVVLTFATELAFRLQSRTLRTLRQDPIGNVYIWTGNFVARTFQPWLRNNNGWAGVLNEALVEGDDANRPRWQGYRNVFSVAGIALGALALGAILTNKS